MTVLPAGWGERSQGVGSVPGVPTKAITAGHAESLSRRLLAASPLQIQAAQSVALDTSALIQAPDGYTPPSPTPRGCRIQFRRKGHE